jgi:protein-tyrosine phosphatase
MIDIHSHILPGLDDGSKSLDESVAMLRQAAAAGTTDIVASPHANQEYAFDPMVVEQKIGELQAAVGDVPQIHYGCDFHLTLENIDDALRSPGKYSIDHRGYLLVEFSDFLVPKNTADIFARLMAAGTRPIIAHPERNPILRNRLPDLERWIAQGCLLQVTAQSLLGRFGKSAEAVGRDWLARGLVHFLASDGHDLDRRPAVLADSRLYVEREFGAETACRLFVGNPQAVLDGVPVALEPARVSRKSWFLPW